MGISGSGWVGLIYTGAECSEDGVELDITPAFGQVGVIWFRCFLIPWDYRYSLLHAQVCLAYHFTIDEFGAQPFYYNAAILNHIASIA